MPLAQQAQESSLPDRVADYRAYIAAEKLAAAGSHEQAVAALEPIWNFKPISPLLGRAAVLAAKSHEQLKQPAEALAVLRDFAERLPQPEGWLLMGRNAEAASDTAGAAAYYQRVFYDFPTSKDAAEAETALARLRVILGDNFPPVMPQARLARADRLTRGAQSTRARTEYASMAADFAGLERDLARVRAVANNYAALEALRVNSPEADAERLSSIQASARTAKRLDVGQAAIDELGRRYPRSTWRLKALVSQANAHLLRNEPNLYEPLYKACYTDFPTEPDAAFCHWKVTWLQHLRRAGPAMMEEHARLYPLSEKASAALYFLGRHTELLTRFPLSYYSTLVAGKAKPAKRNTSWDFQPGPTVKVRLDRAKALEAAGLPEWAEFELTWAAQNEPNSYPPAMALAETAARRGAHDVSIRYIKRFAPGYLTIPLDAAPERFWKLAFPMPYREWLESTSRNRGLDPFIVAALIRQESEFNPRAVSRAKAYGLTQVLPSTGRQISRRAGVLGFSTPRLFEPEVNLKLGTYYLKGMLDQHSGSWEHTLAAYNAGKSRVDDWVTWGEFREPAEFVETVPFTETRNYIQIVLRNAFVYRRLYSGAATGR